MMPTVLGITRPLLLLILLPERGLRKTILPAGVRLPPLVVLHTTTTRVDRRIGRVRRLRCRGTGTMRIRGTGLLTSVAIRRMTGEISRLACRRLVRLLRTTDTGVTKDDTLCRRDRAQCHVRTGPSKKIFVDLKNA